ncbi:alpha/beta hydrolase [Nocardioides sp. zg-536]|uniref:Alpha/beta hydrolase n=1 Tax=Nocardioides faecalis TaxID=2803858 RepID=A0A938Y4B1_9ACTN|nr:alpha/beta hydrolase [Nocardioides faecalis]MBM9459005.1 alpha/beta hydrolase [Nocardioides faecalis]QVI57273.1 alpha/beta hydrolase [Nocardioides faecalis]
MSDEHHPDVLGDPWRAETIELADDFEGEVVATLVSRRAARTDGAGAASRGTGTWATLHVHGFAEYFFQVEYGEWWLERGHDMYALDLRKYGRSLRAHQSATYVADLSDYFEELDAAWERITVRDGHEHVVLSGHSTGGLVVALWAHERRPAQLAGLVLNSPWLDLQGSRLLRSLPVTVLVDQLGRRRPLQEVSRDVSGLYGRSLHREHDGEWDFDLQWKPITSYPVRVGWLAAVRRGHRQLQAGLDIAVPALVLSSDRSTTPQGMDEDVHTSDIVLDVQQIRRWATAVGSHVTYAAVPGAIHDVVLSRLGPRRRAYGEIRRWLDAYVAPRDI